MICGPCRAGADQQHQGGTDTAYGHQACLGGTRCDCQHRPARLVPVENLADVLDALARTDTTNAAPDRRAWAAEVRATSAEAVARRILSERART